jgi:periplasmic protein TonB
MFSRLPESNAPRQRRTGGLVVSTAMHVVLIALAVRATMLTAAPRPKVDVVPPPVYVERGPARPKTPPPVRRTAPTTSTPTVPAFPTIELPAPVITSDVPVTLPDAGAMIRVDEAFGGPSRFSGRDSVVVGGAPNAAPGEPLSAPYVDKVVVALPGTATPRYPSMLQSAGVEGDVHARFVVDTLGRVESGSVRVLDATHDQFEAAVRTALTRARFKPAEAGGHKVRQLVEQTFTFRISEKD